MTPTLPLSYTTRNPDGWITGIADRFLAWKDTLAVIAGAWYQNADRQRFLQISDQEVVLWVMTEDGSAVHKRWASVLNSRSTQHLYAAQFLQEAGIEFKNIMDAYLLAEAEPFKFDIAQMLWDTPLGEVTPFSEKEILLAVLANPEKWEAIRMFGTVAYRIVAVHETTDGEILMHTDCGQVFTVDDYGVNVHRRDPVNPPFNLLDFIVAFEGGELDEDEVIAGMIVLRDRGLLNTLQGFYGRTARDLGVI